jgi:hypothetical protein
MQEAVAVGGHHVGFATTTRADRWWVAPVLTCLGLSLFGMYATWAAFQGAHYWYGSYLSPFYSPLIFIDTAAAGAAPLQHAWLGSWPTWWPEGIPASPAFFILIFPGAFRVTCYYYRKAYYRSFFGTPPGCAVGAVPQKRYRGETAFLVVQNLHRYAMYPAVAFIGILYYDAFLACFYEGTFGIGVGTVILFVNATLLACYTFGCHSFRHLIGGKLNVFSRGKCAKARHRAWCGVSCLNKRHMMYAWISLFWVGFSDVYVRLCSMGIFHDWNTWGF